MNYKFHPEAESEFADAVDYYDAFEQGLGDDLEREVAAVLERILRYPY